MRLPLLALLAVTLMAQDKLTVFNRTWTVPNAQDWKVSSEDGSAVLQLVTPRGPVAGVPRRPTQFALIQMPNASHVVIEADVRPTKRSLILVFAYQDEAHFNYMHMSTDMASKQPVHNGIFHVYGGERVRISPTDGPESFAAINQWFHIKLEWNGATGQVQGYVNDKAIPSLHAVDLSLKDGRIGLGSFDETADFKNVKVQ